MKSQERRTCRRKYNLPALSGVKLFVKMNAYINDSERRGAFQPNGACAVCNAGGYMIQVANGGQAARYQLICEDRVLTRGRWQEIRCTPTGRPYIMDYVRRCRLYFDDFLKF